jgi:hypothetical protein
MTSPADAFAHVSPAAQEIIGSYTNSEQSDLSVRSEEDYSTVFLPVDFVDVRPGAAGAAVFAHCVIRGGKAYSCFNYAINDSISDALGSASTGQRKATGDMTSLTKKGEQSGAFERAIEGLAMVPNGIYWAFGRTVADITTAGFLNGEAALADPDSIKAYLGQIPIAFDPAARIIGPQMGSPFTLESSLMALVRDNCRLELVFDDIDRMRIGKPRHIPENGGASLSKANGLPHVSNFYPIPEGQRWGRSGREGSSMRLDLVVEQSIFFPVDLVAVFGKAAASGVSAPTPVGAALGIMFTAVGPKIGLPSRNR